MGTLRLALVLQGYLEHLYGLCDRVADIRLAEAQSFAFVVLVGVGEVPILVLQLSLLDGIDDPTGGVYIATKVMLRRQRVRDRLNLIGKALVEF